MKSRAAMAMRAFSVNVALRAPIGGVVVIAAKKSQLHPAGEPVRESFAVDMHVSRRFLRQPCHTMRPNAVQTF